MLRTQTIVVWGLSGLFTTSIALAQQPAPGAPASSGGSTLTIPDSDRFYVVDKGMNVNVRTAASVEGGYPFFQLQAGEIIEVIDEKYGWARVRTSTPAFAKAFGYVRADAITADGTTGVVSRRTSMRAPNLNQKGRPSASFEALDPALPAGTRLTLLEQIPGARANDPGNWKVKLPATQMAWINAKLLRPATPAEIAAMMPKQPKPVTAVAEVPTTNAGASPTNTADPTAATIQTPAEKETVVQGTPSPATSTPEEPAEMTPQVQRAQRLAELDNAFRAVLKEDIESAELELLQRQFTKFAKDPEITSAQEATAQSRVDVLVLKIDVQDRLARLKSMRDQTRIDGENITATRMAMDTRAPFDMVGALNASVVFSGNNTMPLLFRLQDLAGGQTIAYVVPDDRYDMAAWTGLSVGIIGVAKYDEALQLKIITPRRIDLLAQQPVRGATTAENKDTDKAPEDTSGSSAAVAEADSGDESD
ncbi:MAG: hypothetical protein CBC35_12470 [Planctomycetes bacterium TMED75]|nr:hypothetical protein [Planctomycetaceae bacterium]OUU90029.1 MAG: hypothetical protein CBC35_12470 [Planctomycetes bacterium TMED75]